MDSDSLLANERSFDSLFCDISEGQGFTIYYNKQFEEDPVFNHVVIDSSILSQAQESFDDLVERFVLASKKLSIMPTIFVEDFWRNSRELQKTAIDHQFRVIERMRIMSKLESPLDHKSSKTIVEETQDIDLWNKIFMGAYSIPDSWTQELLNRERRIVEQKLARLVIASERSDGLEPAGCLLFLESPRGIMGIYCVGTLPMKRSRGIASSMMLFAEDVASKSKCTTMTLQTLESDGVSPMYEKLGYRVRFTRNLLHPV